MSIIGLLCLLFALVAALLLVLYALQRRDMLNVVELSQQLQRIAIGGRLAAAWTSAATSRRSPRWSPRSIIC